MKCILRALILKENAPIVPIEIFAMPEMILFEFCFLV